MPSARRFHYLVSIFGFIFIFSTVVTGLLWAYAPYLYWDSNYLVKENSSEITLTPSSLLSSGQLLSNLPERNGALIESITYRKAGTLIVAEFCFLNTSGKKPDCNLLLASSGEKINKIGREQAISIAREYVAPGAVVKAVQYVENWEHRKEGVQPAVWSVIFEDAKETEIIINALSAKVIEEQDKYRRFHFFIMKLHQFSFFGTHKELVVLSGIPLLLLLLSGAKLIVKRMSLP